MPPAKTAAKTNGTGPKHNGRVTTPPEPVPEGVEVVDASEAPGLTGAPQLGPGEVALDSAKLIARLQARIGAHCVEIETLRTVLEDVSEERDNWQAVAEEALAKLQELADAE